LKAAEWFRRGRLVMVSPVRGDHRRIQAEIPLIVLSRFPGPALKRKADKSDEDDEGEKWDNPIRHGQLHSGRLSWRPLSFADVPFYSLATYVSEAIGHAGPPNLIL
jgi:hypothetical protein